MSKGLTPKQARFVEEYLKDLNATAAAIRAGYSAKTAEWLGPRLATKSHVAAAIAAKMAERSQRTQVDADWLLRRLADIADADMADLYAEDGTLKPVREWPVVWRKGLVAGVEVVEEKGGGLLRKVKLADRLKGLELIGRHIDVGAFRDRVVNELVDASGAPLSLKVVFVAPPAGQDGPPAASRATQDARVPPEPSALPEADPWPRPEN